MKGAPPECCRKIDGQIVLSHAELFQALVHTRAGLPRHGEHAPVNSGALRTRAAQGFAPRGEGERRLRAETQTFPSSIGTS